MSKQIKITIVVCDEKTMIPLEEENEKFITMTHDSSMTIMSSLLKNNLISGSFCGGRGDCGRCRIRFLKGVTMPTAVERSVMTAEELRQGYRLACLAKPKDDCVIALAIAKERKIGIVADMISVPLNSDRLSQQKEQSVNRITNVSCMDKNTTVIAVDLGTTTIAMQLMEEVGGRIIDTYCEMNPQRRYGSDVLSRIKASCEGQRETLRKLVWEVLERGVDRFQSRNTCIRGMCIAGNTVMEHLLMGYDVLSLGSSPFIPVDIGLQECKHSEWNFKTWITPGISAFVGGDIVAGLYALGMLPESVADIRVDRDAEYAGKAKLLIDLGTNGEMAITDGIHMIVTAAAAGPAFEGGASAEIVGSDMIASVALLLQRGVLDETGLLEEPYFSEGISVGEPPVCLRNQDIRDLQMAKAAVRAGVEILWKKMGQPEIGQVYLAGGFGYYLDVEAAFRIGLLPESMRGKVMAVGNTSLAGAYCIGRDLLDGKTDKAIMEKQLLSILSINLAEEKEFQPLYIRYMDFKST